MTNRLSRYGAIDRNNPEASARCDRGGEIRKISELMPEMMWAGDRLVPNGFYCCRFHIDKPNEQSRPSLLRADPVPVRNPRPDIDAQNFTLTAPIGQFKIGVNRIVKPSDHKPVPSRAGSFLLGTSKLGQETT